MGANDRELEALREVEATAIGRTVRMGLVAFFLIILWLPFAGEILCALQPGSATRSLAGRIPATLGILPRVERALNPARGPSGTWLAQIRNTNQRLLDSFHEYETYLKDTGWLPQALRPPVLKAMFARLRYGGEKVYVGHGGWLFYRADVDSVCGKGFLEPTQLRRRAATGYSQGEAVQPDPRIAILDFQAQLARRGVHLVVLPIPVKPVIQADHLAGGASPGVTVENASFPIFLRDLRAAGIDVVDATRGLAALAASGGISPYLATDTHWRPEAVDQVASLLAESVRSRLAPAVGNNTAALHREPVTVTNRGDIAGLLGFDATGGQGAVPAETVTTQEVHDEYGAFWQPRPDADVLLLGDSFTNIYSLGGMGWGRSAGLAEQLSYHLNRPVDRIVRNDESAVATRRILARDLAAGRDRLAGKKVLIWQFASRELCYGRWQYVALDLHAPAKTDFLTVAPGKVLPVTGTIAAVSPVPAPGTVPYKDHVCAVHLVDVTTAENDALKQQAVVYLEGMHDNVWTPAASLRVGDTLRLRLRPWSDVAPRYESVNRTELEDVNLQLQEPSWAEMVGDTAAAVGQNLHYGGWTTWAALLVVLACVTARGIATLRARLNGDASP